MAFDYKDVCKSLSCLYSIVSFNPIVVGLFDSTILAGGGAKKPPYLTLYW